MNGRFLLSLSRLLVDGLRHFFRNFNDPEIPSKSLSGAPGPRNRRLKFSENSQASRVGHTSDLLPEPRLCRMDFSFPSSQNLTPSSSSRGNVLESLLPLLPLRGNWPKHSQELSSAMLLGRSRIQIPFRPQSIITRASVGWFFSTFLLKGICTSLLGWIF